MSRIRIKQVLCEYRQNPLGIDELQPRLSWKMEGDGRGVRQSAYQIAVFEQDPELQQKPVWDTGKVTSDQSIHVVYQGTELKSKTRYFYRVRVWDQDDQASQWSETGYWETGLLHSADWQARWISGDREEAFDSAADYLHFDFQADGPVARARVYATALGIYELHLNGRKADDRLFTPGWTSYRHRLQYQTYDVTDIIQDGANRIGLVVANGWYKGELTWQDKRALYGPKRAALAQLHLWMKDGREVIVSTNPEWRAESGPVLYSELYHGETYDAGKERADWCMPGSPADGESPVAVLDAPGTKLIAQINGPVRRMQELMPIEVLTTSIGETVIDFGQNMVGWVKFALEAPAGTEIVLQHAEVLDKEGHFYTENLRSARQQIRYICKGGGREIYEPHFTFQGFRYVRVQGYPGQLDPADFSGVVIYTDMESTGFYETSEPLLNQLQRNIMWGQKGNFLDVPTDCPQRDERLGWTGDAQVFIRTAAYNMNVAPFFTKWLGDLRADQLDDGGVPFVIPHVLEDSAHSSAAWGDAAVICPWVIYLQYGDRRILQQQYESMKAWIGYMRSQGEEETLWNSGFHFGDWLGLDAKEGSYVGSTPRDLIATAYFAYSTEIVAKTARILGLIQDEEAYRSLHRRIVDAFRREYITPSGRLAAANQTAYVLALYFNLFEQKDIPRAVQTLATLIEENDGCMTTGFVGTPYICPTLTRYGRNDLAYQLVLNPKYPSWLYSIGQGATTIWEHWDGIKPDGTFWSKDMNSFNHYAYGAIGEWFFRYAAGIDTQDDGAGYKKALISPHIDPSLGRLSAEYDSMYGLIKSAWRLFDDNSGFELNIAVPVNTSAQVVIPAAAVEQIRESGLPLDQAGDITVVETLRDAIRLEVGSGSYSFVVGSAHSS